MKLINIYKTIIIILLFSGIYSQGFIANFDEAMRPIQVQGEGERIELLDYVDGKPTVLFFWFLASEPCKKVMKFLDEFQKTYSNRELRVIAINTDNKRALGAVRAFLVSKQYSFNNLSSPRTRLFRKIGGEICPFIVFVDHDGNIISRVVGYNSGDEIRLEADIVALIENYELSILENENIEINLDPSEVFQDDIDIGVEDNDFGVDLPDTLAVVYDTLPNATLRTLTSVYESYEMKESFSIGYEIGLFRDTETIVVEDSSYNVDSYLKDINLRFTVNHRFEFIFKYLQNTNELNGFIQTLPGDYFVFENNYYFPESETIPLGFSLLLSKGMSLPISDKQLDYTGVGFGIYKKFETENYPVYPSLSFYKYSGFYMLDGQEIEIDDFVTKITYPIRLDVLEEGNLISTKGLWVMPSVTLIGKDAYLGLKFGLYRKL